MKTGKKTTTGLLFGSFNPIHTGHLIIAQHMLAFEGLEAVWFVVSPQNPLKTGDQLLPEHLRLELVNLALEKNSRFSPCDMELQMGTPSYTIRTLKKLSEAYPEREFVLLIGSDNLAVFDQWKDYREIMDMIQILVYPRPGTKGRPPVSHPHITRVKAPLLEISSSHIRRMVGQGKDPRYLLPEKVYERIIRESYYRNY
ncbi:MAG: nicotinate (nicotinamide) nucleotide adenylyltransferase [Bacteroidales bacterium]